MRLIATCPEETKGALAAELVELGAKDLQPGFRAVAFEASDALFYELHLRVRLATSGKSLHKRGARPSVNPAPLKETLAASILRLAGYDGTQAFLDPMCGSGTIAIEAAMIALNKAPQIHRKKSEFYFESLKD